MKNFNTNCKSIVTGAATLLLLGGLAQSVAAQELDSSQDLDLARQSLPELDQASNQTRSSSPSMSCFVDTPAFDIFTTGWCDNSGTARTTTAVFRVDNPPSNFTILWSNGSCNSSSTTCFLPIRQYQTITLNATVLNNDNSTFTTTGATASYEGFD